MLVGGTAALARRADPAVESTVAAPSMGPQEMAQQAGDYMTKMRGIEGRVTKLQDQARAKKDVIKLNCVSDKLVQLKGHLAVADQTNTNFNAAISRGDNGGRQHEFTRLTIIFQKVTVLHTEAENCIGEDASYVGQTRVDVDVDPNIPTEDPTEPQLPLPDVSRPPEASPFI
jgi:hypothetical protein